MKRKALLLFVTIVLVITACGPKQSETLQFTYKVTIACSEVSFVITGDTVLTTVYTNSTPNTNRSADGVEMWLSDYYYTVWPSKILQGPVDFSHIVAVIPMNESCAINEASGNWSFDK